MSKADESLEISIDWEEFDANERPTTPTAFDVEQYARAADREARRAHEDPTVRVRAIGYAELTRLEQAALIPLDAVPALCVSRTELADRSLSETAWQMLLRVDGKTSLASILAQQSAPWLDAVREMCELVQRNIVRFP